MSKVSKTLVLSSLVFFLLCGRAPISAQETTAPGMHLQGGEEDYTCQAIQTIIKSGKNSQSVVRTAIEMGHSICFVIKCALDGGGRPKNVIAGAIEAGIQPAVVSKCAIDAETDPEQVAAILQQPDLQISLCYFEPQRSQRPETVWDEELWPDDPFPIRPPPGFQSTVAFREE